MILPYGNQRMNHDGIFVQDQYNQYNQYNYLRNFVVFLVKLFPEDNYGDSNFNTVVFNASAIFSMLSIEMFFSHRST